MKVTIAVIFWTHGPRRRPVNTGIVCAEPNDNDRALFTSHSMISSARTVVYTQRQQNNTAAASKGKY